MRSFDRKEYEWRSLSERKLRLFLSISAHIFN